MKTWFLAHLAKGKVSFCLQPSAGFKLHQLRTSSLRGSQNTGNQNKRTRGSGEPVSLT
jgi:hypothetical protein